MPKFRDHEANLRAIFGLGTYSVIISGGEHWLTFNPHYEIYSFLNEAKPKNRYFDHELDKRALFTMAIVAISTIVGSLAVAGVAMATKNIARAEANRVMEIEASARGAQNEQNIINFIRQNNVTVDLAMQLDRHEFLATLRYNNLGHTSYII